MTDLTPNDLFETPPLFGMFLFEDNINGLVLFIRLFKDGSFASCEVRKSELDFEKVAYFISTQCTKGVEFIMEDLASFFPEFEDAFKRLVLKRMKLSPESKKIFSELKSANTPIYTTKMKEYDEEIDEFKTVYFHEVYGRAVKIWQPNFWKIYQWCKKNSRVPTSESYQKDEKYDGAGISRKGEAVLYSFI